MDGSGDFQSFLHVKIWFLIQLKQPSYTMAPATCTSASRRNLVIAPMTLGIPPKSKISCLHELRAAVFWGEARRKLVPKNGIKKQNWDGLQPLPVTQNSETTKNKKNIGDFRFSLEDPFLVGTGFD